jgi:hypothetical protein
MANAVEAAGQHVDEEAADELVRRQRHGLVAGRPFDSVVLVFEGDAGWRWRRDGYSAPDSVTLAWDRRMEACSGRTI